MVAYRPGWFGAGDLDGFPGAMQRIGLGLDTSAQTAGESVARSSGGGGEALIDGTSGPDRRMPAGDVTGVAQRFLAICWQPKR
jgi:hypothetical protein